MTEFTLHCFAESGNAYKAALMLTLCKADWQAERVAFFEGATRSAEFRGMNAMGEVPVLVHHLPDGDVTLTQSGVILHYLAKKLGRFGPENEAEEHEILRWILFDNHKLTGNLAAGRFMAHFLKKADEPETVFLLARAASALKVLNGHLEGREWVAADRPTIADLSLCGYLFWPDHVKIDWNGFANVNAWLDRLKGLSGWKSPEDLMPSGQA